METKSNDQSSSVFLFHDPELNVNPVNQEFNPNIKAV